MIVELEYRDVLVDRAKYLKNKYSFSDFESLKIAEQELEKQMKKGELENEE